MGSFNPSLVGWGCWSLPLPLDVCVMRQSGQKPFPRVFGRLWVGLGGWVGRRPPPPEWACVRVGLGLEGSAPQVSQ